jgi:hypothetical protein
MMDEPRELQDCEYLRMRRGMEAYSGGSMLTLCRENQIGCGDQRNGDGASKETVRLTAEGMEYGRSAGIHARFVESVGSGAAHGDIVLAGTRRGRDIQAGELSGHR